MAIASAVTTGWRYPTGMGMKARSMAAANANDDHPDFVALSGFEYSRNTTADGGSGHINVLNTSEYVNADHGQRGPAPPWPEADWTPTPHITSRLKAARGAQSIAAMKALTVEEESCV